MQTENKTPGQILFEQTMMASKGAKIFKYHGNNIYEWEKLSSLAKATWEDLAKKHGEKQAK